MMKYVGFRATSFANEITRVPGGTDISDLYTYHIINRNHLNCKWWRSQYCPKMIYGDWTGDVMYD
jgi:hypothetical protein